MQRLKQTEFTWLEISVPELYIEREQLTLSSANLHRNIFNLDEARYTALFYRNVVLK